MISAADEHFHPRFPERILTKTEGDNENIGNELIKICKTEALLDENGNPIKCEFNSLEYVYSAIMDFIFNYITLIVHQGDGIVGTLEHLSTFFKNSNLEAKYTNGDSDIVEKDFETTGRSKDAGLHFGMYNSLKKLNSQNSISKYIMLAIVKL